MDDKMSIKEIKRLQELKDIFCKTGRRVTGNIIADGLSIFTQTPRNLMEESEKSESSKVSSKTRSKNKTARGKKEVVEVQKFGK